MKLKCSKTTMLSEESIKVLINKNLTNKNYMLYVLSSVIMNTNNSLKTQFVALSEERNVITRNSYTTRCNSDTNLICSSLLTHHKTILQHQLNVLHFNSIPPLCTWR